MTPDREAEIRGDAEDSCYVLDDARYRLAMRDLLKALATERERADQAEAAFVGLRETADTVTRMVARARRAHETVGTEVPWTEEEASAEAAVTDACGSVYVAMSALPSSLSGQVRARYLREAANLIRPWIAGDAAVRLDRIADEAESGR